MIIASIRQWSKSDVVEHTSTEWKLARDKKITDIVETKTTTGNDLNLYISTIEIPTNTTYYLQATRHFASTPQADHTLSVKEVRDTKTALNNLILPDYIKIDKPYVYINEADFLNNDSIDFEVKTSKFRSKQDGHSSTHWIVTTPDNTILFTSLYDKFNKTSIRLNKSQDILNRTQVKIIVIHVGTNGVESEPGIANLVNNEFAFDLNGVRTNLLPYTDAKLTISPFDARSAIVKCYLNNQNTQAEQSNSIDVTPDTSSSTITIPGQELTYGGKFYLDIFCYNAYGEYLTRRFPVTVREHNISNNLIDYNFNKKIEQQDTNLTLDTLPIGFSVSELINGNVLLPSSGGSNAVLTKYKIKTSSSIAGTKVSLDLGAGNSGYGNRSDLALPGSVINNVYIKFLNSSLLLIDAYDNNNKPTFRVYRYDMVTDTFTFLQDCVRNDESNPMGSTNQIFQISEDVLWYIPVSMNVIKSYTISTNKVAIVKDLQTAAFTNATLFYNRILNRIFVYDIYGNGNILDTTTLELTSTVNFPFDDWKNAPIFKTLELKNGDYLFLNTKQANSTNSLAYYDSKNNKFRTLPNELPESSNFAGTISTSYNDVLILSYQTDTGNSRNFTINRFF